jgi:two-component system NarL family response regulator
MSVRVLLVDDHRLMRDGLRALLEAEADIDVVGEASDGRSALEAVKRLAPHVVVMDVAMETLNGIEATRTLAANHPEVRVVALSTYSDRCYVLNMLDAGAAGYVPKACASDELVQAIRAVAGGKSYLSPEVTGLVVGSCLDKQQSRSAYTLLSSRERQVLQLIAEGRTSPQISGSLAIAVKTVESHRRNIMRKVGLHNVAELTKYAVREGLTSL